MASSSCAAWFSIATCSSQSWRLTTSLAINYLGQGAAARSFRPAPTKTACSRSRVSSTTGMELAPGLGFPPNARRCLHSSPIRSDGTLRQSSPSGCVTSIPEAERTDADRHRYRKPGCCAVGCRGARSSSTSCIIGHHRWCRSHAPGDAHARSPPGPPGSPRGALHSNFEGRLNGHTIEEQANDDAPNYGQRSRAPN